MRISPVLFMQQKAVVFGQALVDYFNGDKTATLISHSDGGQSYKIPVEVFYRNWDYYEIDKLAISKCQGDVLDIGAGVGIHSLVLQDKGFYVTALDSSESACELLKIQGIRNVIQGNIFDISLTKKFNTWLLLGRSIGLVGDLKGLSDFFKKASAELKAGGKVIFNSIDLPRPLTRKLVFEYNGVKGTVVDWFDVNIDVAHTIASENDFSSQVLYKSDDGNYLIEFTKK